MAEVEQQERASEPGATAVITHRVKDGYKERYEDWQRRIRALSRESEGNLDVQIILPIEGVTTTYTVVMRYDTRENLQKWRNSPGRNELIEEVKPYLCDDADFFIRSGLDFWFIPDGAKASVPMRWKQALVTLTAIYPLVLVLPPALSSLLRTLNVPYNFFSDTLLISVVIVSLMVYLIMPNFTRLINHWLFS